MSDHRAARALPDVQLGDTHLACPCCTWRKPAPANPREEARTIDRHLTRAHPGRTCTTVHHRNTGWCGRCDQLPAVAGPTVCCLA